MLLYMMCSNLDLTDFVVFCQTCYIDFLLFFMVLFTGKGVQMSEIFANKLLEYWSKI